MNSVPGHFEFDHERRILLLVAEGNIQEAEILYVKENIARAVAALNPVAGIADLSKVEKFDVSTDVLRTAARQPSPYAPETPSFIVAGSDHVFGMARMYEFFGAATRANLRVVHSREEALAALGALDAKFEPVNIA